MGISHDAYLVYGLKITDKEIAYKINMDKLKVGRDFEVEWSGSAYYGAEDDADAPWYTFICIKNMKKTTYLYEEPKMIPDNNLVKNLGWKEKLKQWAKDHNIEKPEIGWFLLCTES